MTKYYFIHPTKSGGTAVERYFETHYSQYIEGKGHKPKCNNNRTSIVIVRDVKSRFLSMYKYWKNGSKDSQYKRNNDFKEKHKDVSIQDFINILKTDKTKLFQGFTWNDHFENTTYWIGNTNYENIIIVKYENDLNAKINQLIDKLGIPNKHIELPKVNVSDDNSFTEPTDDPTIDNFISEYFKKDIEFINDINHSPHLFKFVI